MKLCFTTSDRMSNSILWVLVHSWPLVKALNTQQDILLFLILTFPPGCNILYAGNVTYSALFYSIFNTDIGSCGFKINLSYMSECLLSPMSKSCTIRLLILCEKVPLAYWMHSPIYCYCLGMLKPSIPKDVIIEGETWNKFFYLWLLHWVSHFSLEISPIRHR